MYVTNLNYFLDADGNIPKSDNKQWLQLASFTVMVVDTVTQCMVYDLSATYLRCFKRRCKGSIHAGIRDDEGDPIIWACTDCKNSGIIWEWQGSKWDNSV